MWQSPHGHSFCEGVCDIGNHSIGNCRMHPASLRNSRSHQHDRRLVTHTPANPYSENSRHMIELHHEMTYKLSTRGPLTSTAGSPQGERQYWEMSSGELIGPRVRATITMPRGDCTGRGQTVWPSGRESAICHGRRSDRTAPLYGARPLEFFLQNLKAGRASGLNEPASLR